MEKKYSEAELHHILAEKVREARAGAFVEAKQAISECLPYPSDEHIVAFEAAREFINILIECDAEKANQACTDAGKESD